MKFCFNLVRMYLWFVITCTQCIGKLTVSFRTDERSHVGDINIKLGEIQMKSGSCRLLADNAWKHYVYTELWPPKRVIQTSLNLLIKYISDKALNNDAKYHNRYK